MFLAAVLIHKASAELRLDDSGMVLAVREMFPVSWGVELYMIAM